MHSDDLKPQIVGRDVEEVHTQYTACCTRIWAEIVGTVPEPDTLAGFWRSWTALHARYLRQFATTHERIEQDCEELLLKRQRAMSALLQGTERWPADARARIAVLLARHDEEFQTVLKALLDDTGRELARARKVHQGVHGYAQTSLAMGEARRWQNQSFGK